MESPTCTMKALSSMSDEELYDVLGKFVAEVRKEGQEEYPGKTLYEMICCIQAYFNFGLSVREI